MSANATRTAVMGVLIGVVCTACAASPRTDAARTPAPPTSAFSPATSVPSDGSVVAAHAGETWFLGTVPAQAMAADPSLEPIRLGMINQENTPVGSYPELRAAVQAAVAWVNAELGGVDGRPIELLTCTSPFDPAVSRKCADDLVAKGVVAFVGGVDVMSAGAIEVIEQNDLVLIGGIPATLEEQRSSHAFFFSGGDSGALAAFMAHAAESGRTRVGIAYGEEVVSFDVAARDYGAAVGRSLGLEVQLLPYSIFTTDFSPLLSGASANGVDAVAVLAATSSCVPVMSAAEALGIDQQLYLTGACAGTETVTAAGDAIDGVLFNAEGRVDGIDVDAEIYQSVIDRYAAEPAGGAGTVAFRGFMNLYALLVELGPDNVSAAGLRQFARSAVDRPSFWGHPYTCDGAQVPGLPALCAPQQVLFRVTTGGGFESVTDWIATDELFDAALE